MTNRNFGRAALSVLLVAAAACGGGDKTADAAASTDTTGAAAPAPPAATTTDATPAPAAAGALPEGVTAAMVASGESTFKTAPCMACHGADATGTPMAPNLTDTQWLNIDGSYDAIKGVIKTGVAKPKDPTHAAPMPPMGGAQLTDQQISELAAYVYSLSHKG